MTIVNKIIHRFVRPRYEYMNPDGELFSQIIPVNTQAYSYEKIPGANPNLPDSYIVRYVLGTGGSTYAQIAQGNGKDKDGNIIPELSREFVIRSNPQLVDLITKLIKEQVVFASYLTFDVDNNPFPTKEALDTAEAWYINGEAVTPKINDYVIVEADESRTKGSGENPTTRYVCVNVVEGRPVWAFQYEVNNSNFTPEQQAAIDSGITTEKVELYDSYEDQIATLLDHIANKDNPHEVTAEQIGLGNVDNTSDLDKPISTATQEALNEIGTTLNEHINDTNIHVTTAEKEKWNSKQDSLKMGNHIEIKNDVISVLDDLSTYDNRTSRFVSKDSDDLDNYYTKEELDKYLVGGNYKYNGEVATYDDLPHPLVPLGDDYYSLIWITANRLQYIDTGYHCNQDTKIYIKVKLNRGDNYLFSTKMNEPYKVGLAVNYGASTSIAYFGNQEIEFDIGEIKDTEVEIELDKTGIYIDKIQIGIFGEIEDFTTESTLFVPKWNSPDTHSMNLQLYAFRVSQKNIFIRDYLPAINKEDESLVGLYDNVGKSFHTSDSEFEFIPGDYTSSILGGTAYKVLDENRFYMWYKNDWINVAELHKAGIGIRIDKNGTIQNTFDVLVDGKSVVENAVATIDLTGKIDHYAVLPDPVKNLGKTVQYVGINTQDYTHNYFYEAKFKDGRHIWERVNVQPETDLEPVWEAIEELDEKKVTKTDDPLRIYGTDNEGNQTTYDIDALGLVDDVMVKNTEDEEYVTVVDDEVAYIDLSKKVDHYKVLPEPTEERLGQVVQYIGESNPVFQNGLFYKVTISEESGEEYFTWEKIDTTDISEKVDKTHENMKIYGTDEHGNQHLYDKEDFGKVDDVRLNGVSVVENKIANLEPEAGDIAYTNEQYPAMQTLQDAMDKLLYITPSVSLSGGGTYEVGSTRSTTSLTWTWNKAIKTQSLNQGIGSLEPSVRSYTYNTPITSNTTFTITGSDGTTTKSSSTTVSFRKYYYYGTSSKATLSDTDIRGLRTSTSGGRDWCNSNQTLSEKEFNCTPTSASPDGFYAYFVLPSEYAKSEYTVKVNGLPNTGYLKSTKSDYTNEYGVVIPMTIFRFMKDNKLSTKYKIEVA